MARLANMELKKARDASELAEHMMVGNHTGLECSNRTRTKRFTSDHTNGLHGKNIRMGKYDGIHMYSQSGAEALTCSILAIFQKAGFVKQKRTAPSPSIQQADQGWSTSQPARGYRRNMRNQNDEMPVQQAPVWEIPTHNSFSGFY